MCPVPQHLTCHESRETLARRSLALPNDEEVLIPHVGTQLLEVGEASGERQEILYVCPHDPKAVLLEKGPNLRKGELAIVAAIRAIRGVPVPDVLPEQEKVQVGQPRRIWRRHDDVSASADHSRDLSHGMVRAHQQVLDDLAEQHAVESTVFVGKVVPLDVEVTKRKLDPPTRQLGDVNRPTLREMLCEVVRFCFSGCFSTRLYVV